MTKRPPALTRHVELSAEERAASGAPEGLIRCAADGERLGDPRRQLAAPKSLYCSTGLRMSFGGMPGRGTPKARA